MLRFLSAGESHGQALVITVDGMPAGLDLDVDALNAQLRRRQGGYGRGRRMAIESDRAEILAGVRHGRTTGAPIALLIRNRDWVNWQQTMYVEREMPEAASGTKRADVTRPRPGHADLAGAIKYGHEDIRDVLERASARETASRVAAGSLARQLLGQFGVRIASHVSAIGDVILPATRTVTFDEAQAIDDDAPLRCADSAIQQQMMAFIDAAREAGDTVGGAFEVIATGIPPGLGSYVQWDRKLDGRLAQAVMCIHAIKGVGIGIGPEAAFRPGSRVHDEILPPKSDAHAPQRPTNRAGQRLHETDRNADETAPVGRSEHAHRGAGCDRAQRRLRGPGRGGRRRSDGRVRARRRVPGEIRRRLDRGNRASLRGDGAAGPAALHVANHGLIR
jgi:chorismate synthase